MAISAYAKILLDSNWAPSLDADQRKCNGQPLQVMLNIKQHNLLSQVGVG